MGTEPLTKAEKAWLKKLEKVLMNPPTDRLGLSTIGDPNLSVHDSSRDHEINEILDSSNGSADFCEAVEELDAELGSVRSFCAIHSVAG
jgi:hypothetical protein